MRFGAAGDVHERCVVCTLINLLAPQWCVSTALPSAPLALGRPILNSAGLPALRDVCAAILGITVLWSAGLLLRQVYRLPKVT